MAGGGYNVGTAYIQVAPSFDNAQKLISQFFRKLPPIDLPIKINPDKLSKEVENAAAKAGKNSSIDLGTPKIDWTKVNKELDGAGKGAEIEIPADLDSTLLDAKLAEKRATNIAIVATLDLNEIALLAKLDELEKKRVELNAEVSLEKAKAEAELAALEARRLRVMMQIEVDDAKARADLAEDLRALERLDGKTANVNVESSSASRAIGLMGLLVAGIGAVGFAAPAAAAALAAIPAALAIAGQGVAALYAGLNGIGDTVKAFQAADDESMAKATANSQKRVSAANAVASSADQVASAQSSLQSAQTQADRASVNGAEQVASAREGLARAQAGLADAQASALERNADAERSLAAAQQTSRDVQLALNDARVAATERIDDLRLSLQGSVLDEESAALALEKAQIKLAALKNAGVTGIDLHEADLGARQAAQSLLEVQGRYDDLQEAADKAAASGVEGDTAVIAAHKAVADAATRVSDAERTLSRSQVDGAKSVADAQAQVVQAGKAVAKAQTQAAQAQADGAKSVADAQRNLAAASRSAAAAATAEGAEGTVAMDKLHLALSKLTPEGRSFATFLQREMKPGLIGVGDAVQQALLPKLESSMRTLLQLAPVASQALVETGNVIGDLALKGAKMVTSGPWVKDFGTIASNNASIMRHLGDAGLSIADAFRNIIVASGPMLKDFAGLASKSAETFAAFIQGKRDTGELGQFFHDAGQRVRELFDILGPIAKAVWDLALALAPFGGSLLKILEFVAKLVSSFTDAYPGLTNIIAAVGLATTAFILFGRGVSGVIGAFASGKKGFDQISQNFTSASTSLDKLASGTSRLAGAATLVAHPVYSASVAAESLSTAYKVGAERTKTWIDAHRDAPGVLDKIGAAATNAGWNIKGGLTSAVVGASSALQTGLSKGADAANAAFDRVATGAYDAGSVLRTAAVRASLEVSAAFDKVSDAGNRVKAVLKEGLVPTALAIDSATTRATSSMSLFGGLLRDTVSAAAWSANGAVKSLGLAISTGVTDASKLATSALGSFSDKLKGGILKPLVDAQAAYRDTSTSVRDFTATQNALKTPLGQNQTLLERIKTSFSNFGAVAAGAGAGITAGVSGPLAAVKTGFENFSSAAGNATSALKSGLAKGFENVAIAAGGTANAIKSGLMGALTGPNGLMSALGGPWGIAITGAVLGLGLLADANEKAAAAAKEQQSRVDNLARALRDSKGAIDENVRALAAKELQDAQVFKSGKNVLQYSRDLGVALPQVTDAYLGNVDAQKLILGQLDGLISQGTTYVETETSKQESQDFSAQSASVLKKKLLELFGTQGSSIDQNKLLAGATADAAGKTTKLSDAQVIAKNTTDTLNTALATIADTNRDVAERGQAILDFLDKLSGKVPSVGEAADKLNGDIRKLVEGFKNSNGDLIKFGKAAIDASGEIDTTTQAGSDLRAVVKTLGTDMAGAGTAAFDQARSLGKSIPDAYKAAVDAMNPYLGKIKDGLKANGFTEDQIARMLTQYNLVPPSIATTIVLAGDKVASAQVTKVIGDLKALPPNTPVNVTALTDVAAESLLQLGYHIVALPDGTFKVFSNTKEGQTEADRFVAANQGRKIEMGVSLKDQEAQAALDDFKKRNKNLDLAPFISGSGKIMYTSSDGLTHVLGTNISYQELGGLLKFFATGGFNNVGKMSPKVATVVPPNTMRVIGDRAQGDEAFIPINKSPRSIKILTETAARMGYSVTKLAAGALLGFATGGVTSTTPAAATPAPAAVPAAAVPVAPEELAALTVAMAAMSVAVGVLTLSLAALQGATTLYTDTALQPLVDKITTLVVPTLDLLMNRLPPTQAGFVTTTGVVVTSMATMTSSTATAVAQIGNYLTNLRTGLQVTGQAFANTSTWVRDSWGQVREYVAAPSRAALNVMNAGLIMAWNSLDANFGLNKHLGDIPIQFASGGAVHGIGDADSVDAKLTPGEYVFSRPAIDAMGGLPAVDTLHRMAAAGIIGPDTRLGNATDGQKRLGLMSTVDLDDLPMHFAYGGVQPHVAAAGDEIVRNFGPLPGGIGGVGARANVSDHPLGLALDFMTMSDKPLGDKIAGYLMTNGARMLVKYLIWQQKINEGGGWVGMEDRGSPTANHLDHVHTSFLTAGQGGHGFSGEGMVDTTALVNSTFAKAYELIDQFAGQFPGNHMADQAVAITRQATDRVKDYALSAVAATSGGDLATPALAGDVKAYQDYARSMLPRFGWGAEQMSPLIALWNGESKWNPHAENKSSGAFGIPQSLPGAKMASAGADWRTNASTQINWGLGYIKDRPDYGSPSAAFSKWQARSPHWYDDGGWLPTGYSTVGNHTGKPEAILSADQWNSLSRMAGVGTSTGGRTITVNARTDATPDHIANVIDRHLSIGARL